MTRVAIVGNAGGGKSTLGRKLAALHSLPFYSVDQIQWRPGWIAAPDQETAEKIDQIIASERWIVDGWGPWRSLERRLAAADTIIFVDLPLWMHFWLAAERQIAAVRGEDRVDRLDGCDQLAVTKRLFEMIWHVDQVLKPRLEAMIERLKSGRKYWHITSLEALNALAAE